MILYALVLIVSVSNLVYANYPAEDCMLLGFNEASLLCSKCEKFSEFQLTDIQKNCEQCCLKDADESKKYPKAVLEVCTCKFSAYPQIQAFVKGDKPKKYKNLSIKYVRGLDPIIKLYDKDGNIEDVLDIHKWNTDSVDEYLGTHLEMD